MISAYAPQVIVTPTLRDRMALLPVDSLHGAPVGRLVRDEGTLWVSVAAVREWCKKRSVGFDAMRQELIAEKLLLGEEKFYLGKGTSVTTGQQRCWKLDWRHAGVEPVSSDSAPDGKIVKLRGGSAA